MKNNKLLMKQVFVVVIITMGITNLSAHRMWLMPSSSTLSGNGQWVTVDGAISNDLFFPNHHPIPVDLVKAYSPKLKEIKLENKLQGKLRCTFDVQLNEVGTYKVQHLRRLIWANYKEKDEDIWWRGSFEELKQQDFLKRDDVKLEDYLIKVETYLTNGDLTPIKPLPEKKGIILEAIDHVNDFYVGEEKELGFKYNGKPLEGVEVSIIRGEDRYRDNLKELKIKTDKEGRIRFKLDEPGRYWLFMWTYIKSSELLSIKSENSLGYSLVFEVLPQ